MTRAQEIKKEAWENKEIDFPHEFIRGAEWADHTLIDKACEWLLEQEETIGISFQEDFIERFRKAMQE